MLRYESESIILDQQLLLFLCYVFVFRMGFLYYASGVVFTRFQGFGGWFSLLVCVMFYTLPRFFNGFFFCCRMDWG